MATLSLAFSEPHIFCLCFQIQQMICDEQKEEKQEEEEKEERKRVTLLLSFRWIYFCWLRGFLRQGNIQLIIWINVITLIFQ